VRGRTFSDQAVVVGVTTTSLPRIDFEMAAFLEATHLSHDNEAGHRDLVRDLSGADPGFTNVVGGACRADLL
jgi:hypothetical protein